MPPSPASFDTSVLFSTEHGQVDRVSATRLELAFGDRQWQLTTEEFEALHEALEPLAAQVYRCDCDCRWQVRVEGQGAAVLHTDEVLRLHSLLDGAATMLELLSMLDDAAIDRPRE
jgi:hypothetical protein